MADVRQYRQDPQINHGTTAQSNLKLTDIMPVQHENLATQTNSINKISLAQCLCEPFALCNSNNPSNGQYTATCSNFPDFALSYTDSQGNSHDLVGLKVRVKFTYGITYGSVSSGTCPTLNINGSGAIPMLAQGKTMATGAISAEQTVEFTIIPYGNTLAFDADSNVRESTSDYTIYTDGLKRQDNIDTSKNIPTSSAVRESLIFKLDNYGRSFNLTDCNTAENGFRCARNVTNTPNGTQGYVYLLTLSFNSDDNYRLQICFPISSVTFYKRMKSNGVWSNWVEL